MGLGELLLNSGEEQKEASVVTAPAFSLTKVMALVAPAVTAAVTIATSEIKDVTFTTSQITTMIVALVGFLAVTAAADVLARGIATAAEKSASGMTQAAEKSSSARLRMTQFPTPLAAELKLLGGGHEAVRVIAASDASPPEFLYLREDGSISWGPAGDVRFKN